jgi:hypothetical protein
VWASRDGVGRAEDEFHSGGRSLSNLRYSRRRGVRYS